MGSKRKEFKSYLMGKKKKKKKKESDSYLLLHDIDDTLDQQHQDVIREIEELQYKLYLEDQKSTKELRKELRRKNQFSYNLVRSRSRKKLIEEMESTNLFGRLERILGELGPVIVLIGRLVAALITALLSITEVKLWLKPTTLNKLEKVYKMSRAIHIA